MADEQRSRIPERHTSLGRLRGDRAPWRRAGAVVASGERILAARAAPPALRLRVHLRRGSLDRRIASGIEPGGSAALTLRCRQLLEPRARRAVAANLRRLVRNAERIASRRYISAVMIDTRAVHDGRAAILGLADTLAGSEQVQARGVALARELLTDGLGPFFDGNSRLSVVEAVWRVEDALSGRMHRPSPTGGPGPAHSV